MRCTAKMRCTATTAEMCSAAAAEMGAATTAEMGAATTANGMRSASASAASSWSRIRGACYCGGQDNSGIEVYSCHGTLGRPPRVSE